MLAWVLRANKPQRSCGAYTSNGEIGEYCKQGVYQGAILSLDPELLEGVTEILPSSMSRCGSPERISEDACMLTEFNLTAVKSF